MNNTMLMSKKELREQIKRLQIRLCGNEHDYVQIEDYPHGNVSIQRISQCSRCEKMKIEVV